MRWAFVLGLAACGRVGFDPIAGTNGDAPQGMPGDGRRVDGGSAAPMVDAQPFACANALPVTPGVRKTTSTCVGGDHIDGCGPANTQEVVFELVVPATSSYQVEAFDSGTNNTSNSVALLDPTCTQTSGACAGIFGQGFNQGDVVYFIVEAAAGGCAMIDFSVTAN